MAVVINEFEMAPQEASRGEGSGQQQSQTGSGSVTPEMLREIEKKLRRKNDRISRLTAY